MTATGRWLATGLGLALLALQSGRDPRGDVPPPAPPAAFRLPATGFEANLGQDERSVRFLARLGRAMLRVRHHSLELTAPGHPAARVEIEFEGASARAEVLGQEPLRARSHYLRGCDRRSWVRDVPHFARVLVRGLYDGIDLALYQREGRLEYDLAVAPGADPDRIRVVVRGAGHPTLAADGALLASWGGGLLRQRRPVAFQESAGRRVDVAAGYRLAGPGRAQFSLGAYDRSLGLVIDPVIDYATYLGTPGRDRIYGLVTDPSGASFLTGESEPVAGGGLDAFVTRLDATGTTVLFSVYLAGAGSEVGNALALDGQGGVVVVGQTTSNDFPVLSAVQPTPGGNGDAFVTHLDGLGTVLYSTYLGGSRVDSANAVAVDTGGRAHVTGSTYSTDFPLVAPLQGTYAGGETDAFVAGLAPDGASLQYSTYLGGSRADYGYAVRIAPGDDAIVAGATRSLDFPTSNASQPAHGGGSCYSNGAFGPCLDAFVARVTTNGTALSYSTFFGGTGNEAAYALVLDGVGNATVAGTSNGSIPVVSPAAQGTRAGSYDAFVMRLSAAGAGPQLATYLGGSGDDYAYAVTLDALGGIHVAGLTTSSDFPVSGALFGGLRGGYEGFLSRLDAAGSALRQSTFLGGSGNDVVSGLSVNSAGRVRLAGYSASADLPLASPLQPMNAGGDDGFTVALTTRLRSAFPARGLDVDGDGRSDLVAYAPSSGSWNVRFATGATQPAVTFGGPAYVPTPGDYDGDSRADLAVYHVPTGLWFQRLSATGSTVSVAYGGRGYQPVPADYDGDGRCDVAVFHEATGLWFVRPSNGSPSYSLGFGGRGYLPVPADYLGLGAAQVAVYHPATGLWFIRQPGGGVTAMGYGGHAYLPVPGDYDGDGRADVAAYHPHTGLWFVLRSSTQTTLALGFGGPDYLPVPGDHDGDGRTDLIAYHPPSGGWFWRNGSSGTVASATLGGPGWAPAEWGH